jgi:hypothetical protein
MALQKDRRRIFVSGLGKMSVMELEPSAGTLFSDLGYLQNTSFAREITQEDIISEDGFVTDSLTHSEKCNISTNLQQTGIDEISFLKDAVGKVHVVRYDGCLDRLKTKYQYYCLEQAKFDPSINKSYEVGLKPLAYLAKAIKKADLAYDVPLFYLVEANGELSVDKCNLWLDARQGLNAGTVYLLDHSGFARHGVLSATTLWNTTTTPNRFIRFNGTADYATLGDVLDDDGTADFAIECWVRICGADGTLQEIISKRAGVTDEAGYHLIRTTGNKIEFEIGDGSAPTATITSTSSVLHEVWTHILVAIDRNGNGQIYINGAADGAAVDVSTVGNGTNAVAYYLGRLGTGYGEVDIVTVRHHIYGAGGLPTTIASIALNHYNAEHEYYGL